jgi:hypothetical protein
MPSRYGDGIWHWQNLELTQKKNSSILEGQIVHWSEKKSDKSYFRLLLEAVV